MSENNLYIRYAIMPSILTISKTQSGFYQKVVFNLLSKMTKGCLTLTLPNNEVYQFGSERQLLNANIKINDFNFFQRVILYGDIGFGESYVDGDWDTDSITNVIKWFILNIDNAPSISGSNSKSLIINILKSFNKIYHLKRGNTVKGSKKNISEHYDLNNDFFALFLDPTMTYSSAYYKEDSMTLEEAQLAKYKRLCEQLCLKPTDHVLEIGSGWGGNAIYMAKNYGCLVTTLTISEEQYNLAIKKVEKEGLSNRITVLLKDYRLIEGQFDKIVSIEMLEAVGAKYYQQYFKKCSDLLKKDGLFAIQVITCPDSRFESFKTGVDWIQKHIFPGSLLPSVSAINESVNATGNLTLIDLKDIGMHYAHTLNVWAKNFNEHLSEVKEMGFDDYFIRKWNYYLNYCEAAFAMKNIYVMQMVYSRPNNITRTL